MKKKFLLILFVMFGSLIFAQTKVIKSNNGTAQFENKEMWINVVLVNDLKSTINAWNSVSENETPGIRATTKISLENSFIAPFIVYKINSEKIFQIYYDCELIEIDGKNVGDYLDALDCLFAIGKLTLTEGGLLHYAG